MTAPILLVTAYGNFMPSEEVARWRLQQQARPLAATRCTRSCNATCAAAPPILDPIQLDAAPRLTARMLLVEDNPVNQLVAKGMLTKLCEVVVAAHGAEALNLLENNASIWC
jgi:hypothetical protein